MYPKSTTTHPISCGVTNSKIPQQLYTPITSSWRDMRMAAAILGQPEWKWCPIMPTVDFQLFRPEKTSHVGFDTNDPVRNIIRLQDNCFIRFLTCYLLDSIKKLCPHLATGQSSRQNMAGRQVSSSSFTPKSRGPVFGKQNKSESRWYTVPVSVAMLYVIHYKLTWCIADGMRTCSRFGNCNVKKKSKQCFPICDWL